MKRSSVLVFALLLLGLLLAVGKKLSMQPAKAHAAVAKPAPKPPPRIPARRVQLAFQPAGDVGEVLKLPVDPSEPQPPFPYGSEEVLYTSLGARIKGTLTIPPGDGRFPALLLLWGSGDYGRNFDCPRNDGKRSRDGLVLADFFARAGYAVLRTDKRSGATLSELTEDALNGIDFLFTHPRVDRRHIGVMGFSEGTLVATLANARTERVSAYIMVGFPAAPMEQIISQHLSKLFAQFSAGDTAAYDQVIPIVKSELNSAAASEKITEITRGQFKMFPEDGYLARLLLQPIPRSYIKLDLPPLLRRIQAPMLAVFGEDDSNVITKLSAEVLRQEMAKSACDSFTLKVLPGREHSLMKCEPGNSEKLLDEKFLDDEIQKLFREWLDEHLKAKGN